MAALRRDTTTTPATDPATPGVDRRQWWEDVQVGVSAMLTEAARPAASQRRAG